MTIPVHEGCENRLSSGISSCITSKTDLSNYCEKSGYYNIKRQIGISIRSVRIDLKALRDGGFITKETESTRSPWVVLKKE